MRRSDLLLAAHAETVRAHGPASLRMLLPAPMLAAFAPRPEVGQGIVFHALPDLPEENPRRLLVDRLAIERELERGGREIGALELAFLEEPRLRAQVRAQDHARNRGFPRPHEQPSTRAEHERREREGAECYARAPIQRDSWDQLDRRTRRLSSSLPRNSSVVSQAASPPTSAARSRVIQPASTVSTQTCSSVSANRPSSGFPSRSPR